MIDISQLQFCFMYYNFIEDCEQSFAVFCLGFPGWNGNNYPDDGDTTDVIDPGNYDNDSLENIDDGNSNPDLFEPSTTTTRKPKPTKPAKIPPSK